MDSHPFFVSEVRKTSARRAFVFTRAYMSIFTSCEATAQTKSVENTNKRGKENKRPKGICFHPSVHEYFHKLRNGGADEVCGKYE